MEDLHDSRIAQPNYERSVDGVKVSVPTSLRVQLATEPAVVIRIEQH